MYRAADAFGQGGDHPRTGLDQGQVEVFRADAVEAVGRHQQCGMVQFGRQFDASGASADDGHVDLSGAFLLRMGVGAQVLVEQQVVEALGLVARIEEQAVLGRTQGAEVVGPAADRQHQGVIGDLTRRYQLDAGGVVLGFQLDGLARAIEAAHASGLELEVVPLRLGDIVQLVLRGVQRAGGHLVQQWFPDVGEVGVNQGDARLATLAQAAAKAGGQFDPAGAAADNHDVMGHGDVSQGLEKPGETGGRVRVRSCDQRTQQAAQQAQADDHGQQGEHQPPRPERLALDLMLRGAEVVLDPALIFGVQTAGHGSLGIRNGPFYAWRPVRLNAAGAQGAQKPISTSNSRVRAWLSRRNAGASAWANSTRA
ncbi:hypothetical protein D3C75_604810 [compost metagenome]